jgi:hypothetical protein
MWFKNYVISVCNDYKNNMLCDDILTCLNRFGVLGIEEK